MAILITDKFQLRQRNFLDDRQGMASSIADLKFWDFLTVPIPEGFEVYVNGVWYVYKSTNEDDPATGKFRTRESGGLDIEAMWRELEADDETKQISSTHLSNALKKYLPLSGNSADDPMTGPIYLKFGNEDKSANIDDEYLSYRLKNGSATRDAQVSASYGFYYNYALGGSSSTRKYSQIIDDHITLYSLLDGTSSHTVHIFSDRITIDGNYVRHAGDTYYSNGSLVIGGVTVPISGEGKYLPLTAGERYPLIGPLYITNDTGQYGSAKIYIDDENSGDFIIDVSDTFNDRLVVEGDDGILASKFIVPGGYTGFLKADGSIDNNSYFLKSGGTVGYQANKTTPLTVYGYMGSSYIQFESGGAILGKLGFETNTSTGTINPICVVGNTINTIRHSGDTYYESNNDRLVVGGVIVPLNNSNYTLRDLSDVSLSSLVSNGQILRYNSTKGSWENVTPNYLPLTAGERYPLTGQLYITNDTGQYGSVKIYIDDENSGDFIIDVSDTFNDRLVVEGDDGILASKFKKNGGTSSQFLKADGSIDDNVYVSNDDLDNLLDYILNDVLDDYLLKSGGTVGTSSGRNTTPLGIYGYMGSSYIQFESGGAILGKLGFTTNIYTGETYPVCVINNTTYPIRHAGDTYYSNGILVVGGETVPTSEEPEQLDDLSDVSLVTPLSSNQLLRYEIVGNVGVWRNFTPSYITEYDVKHIQVSNTVPDNLTVSQAKTIIYNYVYNQSFGVGDTLVTPASYIYQWDNDSASYYSSDYFSMIKIGGAYQGSSGQWLLSSRGDTKIGYVGRNSGGSWTSIKWLSTTDDLNNYLPLTGNSRNNPITGDLYIAGDTNRFGPVKIWTDEDENGEFIIDLSETNDKRLIVKGTSEINGGLKVRGRYQNSGDAEGIVIGTADNGHAVLCLGNPTSKRSVFYFSGDDVFWRYNNGTTSYDIEHPKQNGIIALRSDLLEYLPLTGGQMISDGTYNGQIYFPVDSGIVFDTDSYVKVLEDDSYLHINGYQTIILEIREDVSSNPVEKVRISDKGLEMIMTEYLGTKLGTLLTDTTLKITGFPIFVPGSGGITPTTEVTAGKITINGYDVIHIGNWRNYIGNTIENQVSYAISASTAGSASYADEANTAALAIKLADNINSPSTDGLTAYDIVNEALNRTSLSRLIDVSLSEPSNLNVLMWLTMANSWTNVSKDNFISLYGLAKFDDLDKYLQKTAGWGEKIEGVLVLDNILALKDQYESSNYCGLYNYENELNFIKNYGKSSSEYIRATIIDSTNWRNYIGNTIENQVSYAISASTAGSASYADEANTAALAIKLADNINSPSTSGLTAYDIVNEALNRTSLSRLIDVSLSEPSNLNVLMWLTMANSWTNVSKDNFISLYGLAKFDDLNGYLPLTAGSSNALTGDLYMGTNKLDMMTVGNVGTTLNHEKLEIKAVGMSGEQQPNTTITAGSISINGVPIPYVIKIPTNTTYYDANNYTQNNTLYVTEGDIVPRIITGWNNFPVTVFSGGFSLVCITEGNYKRQLFSKYNSPFIWVRYQNYSNVSGGAVWTDWQRMATLSDINLSDYLPLSGNSTANPMTGNINWGSALNNEGLYWDNNDISVVADADHHLVLTAYSAIDFNSSYSNSTLMSVSDDYGTSVYSALGNGRNQIIKPVAEFFGSTQETYGNGYVVIELPQIDSTSYYVTLAMTIDIVDGSENIISYDISGELYYFNNAGIWFNSSVNCFTDDPLIRFGFNGTNFVIVIGEEIGGTHWTNPTVVVRNVLIRESANESTYGPDLAYDTFCKNWTISFSKNIDNISFLGLGTKVKHILITNSDGDLDIGQHFIKFGDNASSSTWNVDKDGITVLNSRSGNYSTGSPTPPYQSATSSGLSVVGAIGFQLAVTDVDYKLRYRTKQGSSIYSDWKKLLDIDDLAGYLPLSGNSRSNPMTGNINWGDALNNEGLYWDNNDISVVADADHHLVLTAYSAIDFNSSYSNSTLMSVSDDYGTSVYSALGNGRNQITKPVAEFISYRDSSTYKDGCIAISLPSGIDGTMISMWIDVYDYAYAKGAAFSIHCGGHPFYSSSDRTYVWRGTFSVCYGSDQRVRFGHNGTNFVIYIGETDYRWILPRVSVRDVLVNFIPATNDDQYSILCNDWNISFSTSVQGVSTDNDKRQYVITDSDLKGYLPLTGGVMTKSGDYNGQIYFPVDSGVVFDTDSYVKVLDDSYLHINGYESIIMEIIDISSSTTPVESVRVTKDGLSVGNITATGSITVNGNAIALASDYLPLSGNSRSNPMTGNINWGDALNNEGLYWDNNDISVVADADHHLVLTGYESIDFNSSYSNSTLMSVSDDYGLKMGKNQISRIILDDELDDFDGLEIKLAARNLRITTGDNSTTLYINYDSISLTNGKTPTAYVWNTGEPGKYANHLMGRITASSFVVRDGTSSQFLKADGSVDSNSYITASALSGYLPLTGGTMTGVIRMNTNDIKLGYSGSGSSEQVNAKNAILNNQSLTFNNNAVVEYGQPKPKTTIEAGTISTTGSVTVNGNALLVNRNSYGFYNFVAQAQRSASTNNGWYKFAFPFAGETLSRIRYLMLSFDVILGGSYSAGQPNGTVHVRYYSNSNAGEYAKVVVANTYATGLGCALGNLRICYDNNDAGYLYVYLNQTYSSVAIKNLSALDTATMYNFENTVATALSEVPTNITDVKIHKIYADSSNSDKLYYNGNAITLSSDLSGYLPLSAGSGKALTGDLYMGKQALNMRITVSGNTYGSYLHYNGLQLIGLPESLDDGTSYTPTTTIKAGSITTNGNITVGANSIIFNQATSSTWNVGKNTGLMILNTVGQSSTGAPGNYEVGLSVSGYYGFQIAAYGGSQGGLKYRKIGSGGEYSDSNYDTSWHKLISEIVTEDLTFEYGSGQYRQAITIDAAAQTISFTARNGQMAGTEIELSKITSDKFVVWNGTSSQFLKADGSVDSNSYITASALSGYLPLTGGTLTGDLTVDGNVNMTGVGAVNIKSLWLTSGFKVTMNDSNNNSAVLGYNTSNDLLLSATGKNVIVKSTYLKVDGSVGVGTLNPTYKFEVSGGMSLFHNNIGVDTSPSTSYSIDCGGPVRASSFVNNSDVRRKNIVRYDALPTLEGVANAPTVAFKWKEKPDSIHLGSIAQYWQKVLPEAVYEDQNGYLSMQYDVIALLSAIAVARKVQNHEERILELEQENKILREKISNLEKAS